MAISKLFLLLQISFLTLLLVSCSSEHGGELVRYSGINAPMAKALSQNGSFEPNQLQADFMIFKGILEEVHPGLYRYHSKHEIDTYFEQVERTFTKKNTDLEFYRKLLGIISNIGCGHTWINASELLESSLRDDEGDLPLKLRIIDDKLFSLTNYRLNSNSIRKGDQIISINGNPSGLLIRQFRDYTVGDGHIITGRVRMVERKFNFYYTLTHGQPDQYEITYLNDDNIESGIRIPALTAADIKHNGSNADDTFMYTENISHHFYHDAKTAYIKITGFSDWRSNGNKTQFENRVGTIFERIESAGTTDLIIDLRDNRGGADYLGLLTLSYLIKRPLVEFKKLYLKSINPAYREYTDLDDAFIEELPEVTRRINDSTFILPDEITTKPFNPSYPYYNGSIYVLINGNTFSTATDVAAILHSQRRATFIGEETGGGYYGNSSGYFITATLPHTKFRVRIPLIGYKTNVENNVPPGRGVIPYYALKPDIQDIINGRDTELQFALDLIINKNH